MNDAKSRLNAYLEEQLKRRQRMDDPAYRKSVNADMMGAADSASRNNLAALLMDSASMAGSVGGKRADASPVAEFAQRQNKAMNDYQGSMANEEEQREKRYGMDAKLYEYLAQKQQAQEDREATARYRKDNLAQQKTLAQGKQDLEKTNKDRDYELKKKEVGLKEKEINNKITTGNDKPPTEGQFGAANFGRKAQDADAIVKQLEEGGYDPSSYERVTRNANIPFTGIRPAASETDRRYEQAQKEFIAAILRKESAGAITAQEFKEYGAIYFPQAGDGREVRAQKAAARKAAADNLIAMSGPAAAKIANRPLPPPTQEKQAQGEAFASEPSPGKVFVTNGSETREIDEADLAEAQKDGYTPVGGKSRGASGGF